MDKKLFLHDEMVIKYGLLVCETDTFKIRLDAINERNTMNIKKFTLSHIKPGTSITNDGWSWHSFLNDDSACDHEIYNHGHGEFRYGLHSNSYIKHTWNSIVQEIKKYKDIFKVKIIYTLYLKENLD